MDYIKVEGGAVGISVGGDQDNQQHHPTLRVRYKFGGRFLLQSLGLGGTEDFRRNLPISFVPDLLKSVKPRLQGDHGSNGVPFVELHDADALGGAGE